MEWLGPFLSAFDKLKASTLIPVAIGTSIFLFASDQFIAILGLAAFRDENLKWIGVAWIVAISILFANLLQFAWTRIASIYGGRQRKKSLERQLHNLTVDERHYVLPYVQQDIATQYFDITDGTAGGLEAKKIIFKSSHIGSAMDGIAYNLQPWAREYLKSHPELFDEANS